MEWDASSLGSGGSMESAGTNALHRLKNEQAKVAAAEVMKLHWEVRGAECRSSWNDCDPAGKLSTPAVQYYHTGWVEDAQWWHAQQQAGNLRSRLLLYTCLHVRQGYHPDQCPVSMRPCATVRGTSP